MPSPLRLGLIGFLLALILGMAAAPAQASHGAWQEETEEPADYEDPWWTDEEDEEEAIADPVLDPEDPGLDATVPVAPPAAPKPKPAPLPALKVVRGKFVKGRVARMRADGKAAIPLGAPKRVRVVIAAANQIVGKPYKWGGGHGRLFDSGYDCSGAVGYALIRAGLMRGTMVSGAMARWGFGGAGRWISVYANKGHVYMEVAGLRLDTSSVGDYARRSGVRWRPVIGRRGGFHARHPRGF